MDTNNNAHTALLAIIVAGLRALTDIGLNSDFLSIAQSLSHSTGAEGIDTETVGEAWDTIADELAPRVAAGEAAWEAAYDAEQAASKFARDRAVNRARSGSAPQAMFYGDSSDYYEGRILARQDVDGAY